MVTHYRSPAAVPTDPPAPRPYHERHPSHGKVVDVALDPLESIAAFDPGLLGVAISLMWLALVAVPGLLALGVAWVVDEVRDRRMRR